ncbi:hypothetical protein COO60DRAFT_1704788 [Scenedesmus sp. NREL 46B-D3]|nr:hypothetical protein COO60DRAFT_1704788 [Scenedesmus sp. NREL 46B-D3]
MQINGRSSGTTTINKIVVAGLQRLPEHDPQQAEQAAAHVLSGLPCLDVEASSKAKAAVFVPGFPTVKTSAGKFPAFADGERPAPGRGCYIADWVKASWSKTKSAAITAKGGERLSSEEVEAAYNSPDMDLARSLEFIAVSRAGKMEVTCSFRHAEIVAHLTEIPGIELMHPDNGVLRLVYPKTELKRNLLKLGLNCSVEALLEPGVADALIADLTSNGKSWHDTYVGALPSAAASAMNRSPAGKRATVDAAVAAAANPFKPNLRFSGLFDADGISIAAISRESLARVSEVYVGCCDAATYTCAYGGATMGMHASVISIQPHPGGLIRYAEPILATPTLLAKMSKATVQQRYFAISKRILITSSALLADPTGKSCCRLAELTGDTALDNAALLRGADSLCQPPAPAESQQTSAADEPEDSLDPALAMDSLFPNIDQITAAEAAAKARAATTTPATTAPAESPGTSAAAGAHLAPADSKRPFDAGRGSSSAMRGRSSARGGIHSNRQAPAGEAAAGAAKGHKQHGGRASAHPTHKPPH